MPSPHDNASANLEFSLPGQQLDELLSVKSEDITTVIDIGVEFEGHLNITNGRTILISGKVDGKITSNGAVVVNQGAEVHGSIRAKSLQLAGLVARKSAEDLVEVDDAIVLSATAVLECNSTARGLKTEYGAELSGTFYPRKADAVQSFPVRRDEGAVSATRQSMGAYGQDSCEQQHTGGAEVVALHASAGR